MLAVNHIAVILTVTLLLGMGATTQPELTKADIPSGLPADLTALIEKTFSDRVTLSPLIVERAVAARQISEMHERAAAAIPFLIRLLGDDSWSVQSAAIDALSAIGEPAVGPLGLPPISVPGAMRVRVG